MSIKMTLTNPFENDVMLANADSALSLIDQCLQPANLQRLGRHDMMRLEGAMRLVVNEIGLLRLRLGNATAALAERGLDENGKPIEKPAEQAAQ